MIVPFSPLSQIVVPSAMGVRLLSYLRLFPFSHTASRNADAAISPKRSQEVRTALSQDSYAFYQG